MADVSSEVAGLISGAKVFGASENIRHGTYKFLIKRIFAELVELDKGKSRMAFWEVTPIESKPNPQTEGDHTDYPGIAGPLVDDGTRPNPVGSNCALKINFDGAGARSAGANVKQAILALFGKRDGELPDEEVNKTWLDLSRQIDLKIGDAIGINSANNQPIYADKPKLANPACGMVIACTTMAKKKKTPNEKGAYVTKLIWSCVSPPGTGENSLEQVAKRRAEIEASRADEEDDAAEVAATAARAAASAGYAPAGYARDLPSTTAGATPPAPPAPPAPPLAPAVPFTPPPPWRAHPTAPPGNTPETRWFWDGVVGVKSEAQFRAGQ